jgi:hypothetical protein
MKKFLILSFIVGLAGIGAGVARQSDSPATTVEVATDTSTTTAIPDATASSSTTTIRKLAVKATTATTARGAISPTTAAAVATTTSTTRPAVTTTTASAPVTPTTAAGPTPTCTLSQEARAVRLTSNLPNTPYKMVAVWPADPNTMNKVPQQFVRQATTNSAGGDLWNPVPSTNTGGTARISVSFYPAGARSISTLCSTSFQS